MTIQPSCFPFSSSLLTQSALNAIDAEGPQAPSLQQLTMIIEVARRACHLLSAAAMIPPAQSEVLELFVDFVVRCVNRPSGVGDAAAD